MSQIESYESRMMLIFHHLFTLTGWPGFSNGGIKAVNVDVLLVD